MRDCYGPQIDLAKEQKCTVTLKSDPWRKLNDNANNWLKNSALRKAPKAETLSYLQLFKKHILASEG